MNRKQTALLGLLALCVLSWSTGHAATTYASSVVDVDADMSSFKAAPPGGFGGDGSKAPDGGNASLGTPDFDVELWVISGGDASGWKGWGGAHYVVYGFDSRFGGDGSSAADVEIHHFGRGDAEVLVSDNMSDWHSIGNLPDVGHHNAVESFDLDGLGLGGSWQWLRIDKLTNGSGTGRYIDAVGVNPVPLPAAFPLFLGAVAALGLTMRRQRRV